MNPFIALHVFVYRLTGGRIGGKIWGTPVMLLTTLGRRSGKYRTTPVLFLQREHDWVIVASNAGRPKNPTWYYNLKEDPAVTLRVRNQIVKVHAREASEKESTQLWDPLSKMYPPYDDYRNKTSRRIPILVLEAVESASVSQT